MLLYGNTLFHFKLSVPANHEKYEFGIVELQWQFFSPFPLSYQEICPPETLGILVFIMQNIPPEKKKMFARISESELSRDDKEFVLRIMKLDPKKRPSAADLLQDEWLDKL